MHRDAARRIAPIAARRASRSSAELGPHSTRLPPVVSRVTLPDESSSRSCRMSWRTATLVALADSRAWKYPTQDSGQSDRFLRLLLAFARDLEVGRAIRE